MKSSIFYFLFSIFYFLLVGGIFFPLFSVASPESIEEFYVASQYEPKRNTIEKALHLTSSTRAQFFVEKDYYDNLNEQSRELFLNNTANLGVIFDTRIYFQEKALFGDEWSPGIDNNQRIIIYLTEMRDDVHGYFLEANEYDSTIRPNSNKREMIYINVKYALQDIAPAILAHEFQHLINFNQKRRLRVLDEEQWLNEAFSEYTVTLTGYSGAGDYLAKRAKDFLTNPTDALGIWEQESIDNASASLFIHYLVDQYGEDILRDMIQSDFSGGKSLDFALRKNGVNKSFSDIFRDWTVALFLNASLPPPDRGNVAAVGWRQSIYRFTHPDLQYNNLHVMPQLTYSVGETVINASFAVQDLSPQWHRFLPSKYTPQNPQSLFIVFTSRDTDYFRMPVVITYLSGDIEVLEMEMKNSGFIEIPDFNTKISSVVVIPASHTKLSNFSLADPLRTFSYSISLVSPYPGYGSIAVSGIRRVRQDGDLIRAEGRPEVYVIKDGFRRHLQHPVFFDFYGHLRWENVQIVSENIAKNYKESKLIRKAGDYKVYETIGFRQFHWLDMTPQEFEASGRKWEQVYEVNKAEWGWYKEI